MTERARVLVVDDDALIGSALRRVLRGHDVEVETDPRRAVARLVARERFDLVLCDFHMPWLNGAEVLRAVATAAPELLGRFVFMTAGSAHPAHRAVIESAPGGYVMKPFDSDVLRRLAASAAARPAAEAARSELRH
jgi:DNA-binding NarL/FixJ family response regulator